jgi:hypothetical protein
MYFEEMPDYGKIVSIEEKMTSLISDNISGITMSSPLPILGITDLIFEENGELIIEDYKFKTSHTTLEDGVPPAYIFQGIFYFLITRAKYGRSPKEIRFREVKI